MTSSIQRSGPAPNKDQCELEKNIASSSGSAAVVPAVIKLKSIRDSVQSRDRFTPYAVPIRPKINPIILRKARSHWGVLHCFSMTSLSGSMSEPPKQILLVKDQYWIGRHPDADVVPSSPLVSGHHFVIRNNGGVAVLEDVSLNGTHVDGTLVRAKTHPLSDISEIYLASDHYFVFTYPGTDLHWIKGLYYLFKSIELGRGSFAKVYLAIDRQGRRVACKKIDIRAGALGDNYYSRIKREVELLTSISHFNIVSILDWSSDKKHVYVFLTRVKGGELFDRIVADDGIDESETKFIFYQTLLAVKYLHDKNICHRDIKAENILLDSKSLYPRVLLADFGMSKVADHLKTKCGTSNYLAPEIMDSTNGYTKEVDCWSLGVLLFTMIQGNLPFLPNYKNGVEVDGSLMIAIRSASPNFTGSKWRKTSTELKSMIRNLLNPNARERLTISEAMEHPWIQDQIDTLKKLYSKLLSKSSEAQ